VAFPIRTGGSRNDIGHSVATFSDDTFIISGQSGGGNTRLDDVYVNGGFIAKFDKTGRNIWVQSTGPSQPLRVNALNDGGAIVSGTFEGQVRIGDNQFTSAGDKDGFIAKVDRDGNYQWVKQIGGAGADYVRSNSSLNDGSSIVSGDFTGTATFGGTQLTSSGRQDGFVAKLDSNGNYVWLKQFGGASNAHLHHESGTAVSSFSDGSSILAGTYGGTVNFGGTTFTSSENGRDAFVAKLDANGNFLWAKQIETTSHANDSTSVATHSDGSSIVTGWFRGTTTFGDTTLTSSDRNDGTSDGFVAKLDSNGNYLWVKQIKSKDGNSEQYDEVTGIDILSDGSSIITGTFGKGTISFGGTQLTTDLTKTGFVAKLDSNGNYLWATKELGGKEKYVSARSDGSSIINTGDYGGPYGASEIHFGLLDSNGNISQGTGFVDGLRVELQDSGASNFKDTSFQTSINIGSQFDVDRGGDGSNYIIQAKGQIQAYQNGRNTWKVHSDDQVSIRIDNSTGQPQLEDKNDGAAQWHTLTFSGRAGSWYDIDISYSENGGDPGKLALYHADSTTLVTELRSQTTAPALSQAATTADGNKITLSYDQKLYGSPDPASFSITSNGSTFGVQKTSFINNTPHNNIELWLNRPILKNETVTISYTDPRAENDKNAIENRHGYDAASLNNVAVSNKSTLIFDQIGDEIRGRILLGESGHSIALSEDGSILAVGAPNDPNSGLATGQTRIYKWNSLTKSWDQRGNDIDGSHGGEISGHSVRVSSDGSIVAINSPGHKDGRTIVGTTRIYEWDSANNDWTQRGNDIDGQAYREESFSLSGDGNTFAIAGLRPSGHWDGIRIYDWDASAKSWGQRGTTITGGIITT